MLWRYIKNINILVSKILKSLRLGNNSEIEIPFIHTHEIKAGSARILNAITDDWHFTNEPEVKQMSNVVMTTGLLRFQL